MKRTSSVPVLVAFIAFVALLTIASSVYGAEDSEIDVAIANGDKLSAEAYSRGDYRAAVTELSKAVELFEKKYGADRSGNAVRYCTLGTYQYYAGDYSASLLSYEKSLRLYGPERGENRLALGLTYSGLANSLHMTGKYGQAISAAERAMDIYSRTTLPDAYKWCPAAPYYTLGLVYQYKGEYAKSDGYLLKSKDIYDRTMGENHPYSATVVYAMGDNARLSGDHVRARQYFEKTRDIYVTAYGENHPYVGSSYYALALEYYNDGEYGKAISCYLRAAELYRNAYGENHAFVAVSYFGLARVLTSMGDYERAIGYLEKSRDIDYAVFGEEHINTIATLFGLAEALAKSGAYDDSLKAAQHVLALHRKVLGENHPESANVYFLIGSLYSGKIDYPRAIENYRKALEITELKNGADHPTSGSVYTQLGIACYMNGDAASAEKYIGRGLEIGKKKMLPELVISASGYLGYMRKKAGDWKKAREYFDGVITLIEQERSKTDAERSAVMDTGAEFYYESIESSAMLGDADAMFSTAEQMKARSFLDRITLEAALSVDGISPEDRKKMMSLNEQISSLVARRAEAISGKDGKTDEKLIASLGKQIEKASGDFDRFDAELMKNDGYRRLRKSSTATMPQAQSLCDGESAILEYVCDAEGKAGNVKPYCIVIRDKSKSIVSLDASYDYNKGIAKFREAIIEPNRKRERIRIGKELHGKLIEPLAKHLAGVKKLIIIPDGQLAFLPFDALSDGNDGNGYLCEKYGITLDPSVSVLLMTRMRKSNTKLTGLLAFGGADYSDKPDSSRGRRAGVKRTTGINAISGLNIKNGSSEGVSYYDLCGITWENLPGTLDEVREIGEIPAEKKDVLVVTGKDVSEATVKRYSHDGTLSRFRTVHFACHGYFDPERVAYSSVVLSEVSGRNNTGEDGYLSVPEVAALRFKADVVTLSACETGLGKFVRGDGVSGLARAFQEAGASRVNVTLWQVADEATRRFMVEMYKKINNSKESFSKAMSDTKREFIRSNEFNEPYFWSSFVLYGD